MLTIIQSQEYYTVLLEQLAKQDRSSAVLEVCASTYKQ